MTRVLISFLGTGPFTEKKEGIREYQSAQYRIDGKEYETPFVSAALAEHLNIEKKVILGTAKSMWEEYYRYITNATGEFDNTFYKKLLDYSKTAGHETYDFSLLYELEERLENTNILILKYGLNDTELKYNIEQVLKIDNILDRKDGVYMDVTHGFRTFPLLAQQVVFYLKEVSSKNIKFRNFYYGMLDAIRDLKYAPVVDLKIMFEMNDWIIGANIFKTSMNGSKIVSLIKKKDENLAKMLDEFSKALNINYAYDIQQQIEILKDFDTSEIGNPEKLIVDKILKDFVGHFSNINKHSCFQFDLAKWYYEKNNYGNAYVILTESIITLICEKFDNNPFQKENRNKAKSYLSQINKKSSNELAYLSAIYSNLVTIRNNISHNLQKRPNMYLDDIGQLSNFFKLLKKYF